MELSDISRVIAPTLSRQLFMMAKQYSDVIDFTLGDPDIPTHKDICEAAYNATMDGKTRYAPNAGLPSLRETIASYTSAGTSYEYKAENVAVTFGATEAIYLAFMAILNPGDEVIILAPYWVQYENIVKLFGAEPVIVDEFNHEFEPSLEAIKKAITPKAKAIVVNSPNNPSGYIYGENFLKSVSELAVAHNLCIFADEVYKTLIYNKEYVSIAEYCPKEQLVIFNSFSKMFAMTGWRVGYVVADEEFIKTVVKLQQNIAVCVATPSQYAAIEAMANAEKYTSLLQARFASRRKTLCQELDKCDKISYVAPDGTFYALLDISATGLDSKTFCFSLLEKEHVAVIPGIAFGEAFDKYVRLAFTLNEDCIVEGINRICKFINNL